MSSGILEPGLSIEALQIHRALASLQEELEAIDCYQQRADVTNDESLEALLLHNRNDEMEHAAMLLEWLRGILPDFDQQLRSFLFKPDALSAMAGGGPPPATNGTSQGLGIGLGNLRPRA
jgi:hypothetical protein